MVTTTQLPEEDQVYALLSDEWKSTGIITAELKTRNFYRVKIALEELERKGRAQRRELLYNRNKWKRTQSGVEA